MKAPIAADPTPMPADEAKERFMPVVETARIPTTRLIPDSSAALGVGSADIGACGTPHGSQRGVATC